MTKEIKYPNVKIMDVSWGRRRTDCPDHKAVVNTDTGYTYAIPKKGYQLVKHESAIDIVDSVLDDMSQFGEVEKEIRLLDDEGGKLDAIYTFPEIEYEIQTGDTINPTIHLKNSYNTKWLFSILFGAFRQVCSNGMVVGDKFVHYRKKHTQGLSVEQIRYTLKEGMNSFSDKIDLWKTWLDRETTSHEYEEVAKCFSPSELNRLMVEREIATDKALVDHVSFETFMNEVTRREETKVNVNANPLMFYTFFNIITQFITHKVSRNRQISLQGKLNKVF